MRPANQYTITYVVLGHKTGWTPICVAILWITKFLTQVETLCFSVRTDTRVHLACYAIRIVALFDETEHLGRAAGVCLLSDKA